MFEKIFHTVIEISLGTSVVIFLFLVTKPLLDKRYSAKWRYCVWLILALLPNHSLSFFFFCKLQLYYLYQNVKSSMV